MLALQRPRVRDRSYQASCQTPSTSSPTAQVLRLLDVATWLNSQIARVE